MISQLELKQFKCFEHLKLPLSNLTVLSGANASGKSSVLQALALLHQTMREQEWSDRLALNGGVMQAGLVSDVVDQAASAPGFEIGLSDDSVNCNWAFAGDGREMSAKLVRVEIGDVRVFIGGVLQYWSAMPRAIRNYTEIKLEGDEEGRPARLRWLLPELHWLVQEEIRGFDVNAPETLALGVRDLMYITAEREGPRETYPLMDDVDGTHGVGTRGEYAASVLYQKSNSYVEDDLRLGVKETLAGQVNERLGSLFPGCLIRLSRLEKTNAIVLEIQTSEETGFVRPIHSGFGITQILPIIVAVLSAHGSLRDNPLILIENPEVHLHPSGQALMGEFLAEAAHAGVQIIAETHSDHVLNGVRRAVKSGKANADEVAVHFFQDRFENESQVLSPVIDSSGKIDHWPEGFFDQFDKDLEYFAGWGE